MNFTKKIFLAVSVFSILLPVLTYASFDASLKSGSSGSAVVALQNFLQTEGFLTGKADGKFGSGTKKAVIAFQSANGLTADGSFGPASRAKANVLTASSPITSGTISTNTPITQTAPAAQTTPVVAPLSGTLDLAVNSSYPSSTILPPQQNVKFADFTLTNNTTEAVNINKLEVDLIVDSDANIATRYVKNLYVVSGNNQTPSLGIISPQNYLWPTNFQLAAGKSADLSLYGDINSAIPLTSVINTNLLVSGVSALSKTQVYSNQNVILSGQNVTFSAGSLSVGGTATTIPVVLYNQRVVAGAFQFTATADSYNISQLRFIIPNINNSAAISDVVLKDSVTNTTIATAPIKNNVSGNNSGFDFFNLNIPVPFNSSSSVTLYYDLSSHINSTDMNVNISPVLGYVRAMNSKGLYLDGAASNYSGFISSNGGIVVPASGVAVGNLSVFKTIPTLAQISVGNTDVSDGSNINLYKFSITADKSADVSVKQLTLSVALNDPSNGNLRLNNFSFLKDNAGFSEPIVVGIVNNSNFIGLGGAGGIGAGANNVVVNFSQEEIIPAGKTEVYTLKAHVSGLTGGASISTMLPSDGGLSGGSSLETIFSKFYDGLVNTANPAITYYNFLWSDMSETSPNLRNDANGNSTNDWYDGGSGVLGLPLSTETVSGK